MMGKLAVQPKTGQSIISPRKIEQVADNFFGLQLGTRNDEGIASVGGKVFRTWSTLAMDYLVDAKNWDERPLVSVLTEKLLLILTAYAIEQYQPMRSRKVIAEFTLDHLMADLGYGQTDRRVGGKKYSNLKRALYTLGNTRYRIARPAGKGKSEIIYANFFTLYELVPKAFEQITSTEEFSSKGKGIKYKAVFNDPYDDYIEEMIRDKRGKFVLVAKKLLQDREVNANPALFKMIKYIIRTKGGVVCLISVEKLLKKIRVQDRYIRQEPQQCFYHLWKALIYAAQNYPELFTGIRIANPDASDSFLLTTNQIRANQACDYFKFCQLLRERLGVRDIRECKIGFVQSRNERSISGQSNLGKQIMQWINETTNYSRLNTITEKGTARIVNSAIEKLGEDIVRSAFESVQKNLHIQRLDFSTKILSKLIKNKDYNHIKRGKGIKAVSELVKPAFMRKNLP